MSDSLFVGPEAHARDAVALSSHRAWLQFWPRLVTRDWQNAGLLCVLVVLQLSLAISMPFGRADDGTLWDLMWAAGSGFSFALPAILAVWTALGAGRAVVRLPATLWLATAVYACVLHGAYRAGGSDDVFLYCVPWMLAYCILQLPLWLLRGVRGWRLELTRDPERQPYVISASDSAKKTGRHISLRDLFGWTLAASGLLAVMRLSMPETAPDLQRLRDALPYIVLEGLVFTAVGLPVIALAWIFLATGRRPLFRAALALVLAVSLPTGILLFADIFNSKEDWASFAVVEAGTIANGVACLIVMWTCGYRLNRFARASIDDSLARQPSLTAAAAVPLSRSRFAIALAPLLAMAAIMIFAAAETLETWRQEATTAEWVELGFLVTFDDNGALDRACYQYGGAVSDKILKRISAERRLTSLDLSRAVIDDRQLALLSPLTNLADLRLCNCNISDNGLAQIARFIHLEELSLDNTRVTDAGLPHLLALRHLQTLSLKVTEVTDSGLQTLAKLPQLDYLDVSLTAITPAAESVFQAPPVFFLCFGATDQALAHWLETEAVVAEVVVATGHETLFEFTETVDLRTALVKRLHLRGGKSSNGTMLRVTDMSLKALAEHPELEELDLRDSAITDSGLEELVQLRSLKRLDLRGTVVTEQAVARLAESLPDCEILPPL